MSKVPKKTARERIAKFVLANDLAPQAPDAERGLLSSILLSPNAVLSICVDKGINPNHFYGGANRKIFEVLILLWSELPENARLTDTRASLVDNRGTTEGEPKIDFITLTQKLRDLGELDKTGGAGYVTDLFTFLPTAANAAYYVELLLEKWSLRNAQETYIVAAARCHDEQETHVAEIIADASNNLVTTIARREVESVTFDAIAQVERQLQEREVGIITGPLGVPTGVPGWINSLRGLFPGTMYVIAARPGVGKSSLIEQMMITQMRAEMPIMCVQKDMSVATMIGRMASREANVSYEKFVTGELSKDSLDYFRSALDEFKDYAKYLHLFNTPGMTAEQLDIKVRAMKERYGIVAFYLDHFTQLKRDRDKGQSLSENLTIASGTLRSCITETDVPGVIIVHLNREAGKTDRPNADQIKYCDGLLADSDVTALLFSTQDPRDLDENVVQEVTMSIEKYRNGSPGDELMYFHRERTRFVEV